MRPDVAATYCPSREALTPTMSELYECVQTLRPVESLTTAIVKTLPLGPATTARSSSTLHDAKVRLVCSPTLPNDAIVRGASPGATSCKVTVSAPGTANLTSWQYCRSSS